MGAIESHNSRGGHIPEEDEDIIDPVPLEEQSSNTRATFA
jgi:hypothetical protein